MVTGLFSLSEDGLRRMVFAGELLTDFDEVLSGSSSGVSLVNVRLCTANRGRGGSVADFCRTKLNGRGSDEELLLVEGAMTGSGHCPVIKSWLTL